MPTLFRYERSRDRSELRNFRLALAVAGGTVILGAVAITVTECNLSSARSQIEQSQLRPTPESQLPANR